jgi:exodeoxyribonuclease VII large subunit
MVMAGVPQTLTLFELNNQVKEGIRNLFPGMYWVVGEISDMNVNQSGHCYLELIEKNADSDQITARVKATIWAFTFRMLRPYFESATGQRLSSGMKILIQVSIEFHEIYGYSLNVKDIEPNFTLGDLSRKRKEIIQRLTDEGVIHLNKELDYPVVPQRIAVISSETAAGFGDFVNQLNTNRHGFRFDIRLFQAFMQGNETEQSIITALETIYEFIEDFDVVVIIRGGGAQADLECFNSYWLCYHITQFPLPVITGIGHERDETIADLVAHVSLKTPTAVAGFLIDGMAEFDGYINDLNRQVIDLTMSKMASYKDETDRFSRSIISLAKLRMSAGNQKIQMLGKAGQQAVKGYFQRNHQRLAGVQGRTKVQLQHSFAKNTLQMAMMQKNTILLVKGFLKEEKQRLEQFGNKNHLLDPVHILKRGYTLTYSGGMLIKNPQQLKPGDQIESKWGGGTALSTIDEIQPKPEV